MKQNSVRIIAGKWRHRKIHFPENSALRPTSNRIRETLFNWLQFHLKDSRCLDLFSGSGALGFEALSRGAAHVVFIENNPQTILALRKNATALQTQSLEIIEADAIFWLKRSGHSFDIVFLDPPYQSNFLATTFNLLETQGWLHSNSLIYFESNNNLATTALPLHWQILYAKKAGHVYYYLSKKIS